MSIEITGKTKNMSRIYTGFYSLDKALENSRGDFGFPQGSIIELYGRTGIGKSTVALSIISKVNPEGEIDFAELEGIDPYFMETILGNNGFTGKVNLIVEETDNLTLEKLSKSIPDGRSGIILDSIGAIIPVGEGKGKIGDANMGRRALILNQFARRIQRHAKFHDHHFLVIMTNHEVPVIGGFGTDTPGGEGKKFASQIRIALMKGRDVSKKAVKGLIKGRITKNRWGYDGTEFYLYNLFGHGIHEGMTALYDCLFLGLAEKTTIVKMDGEKYGSLKSFVEMAKTKQDENFIPFIDKIKTLYLKE